MVLLVSFLGVATVASADPVVDCSRRSLANVVDNVHVRDVVIRFTGVCNGPIVISTDGITLQGVGNAVIDGGGAADAVTIAGSSRVALESLEVRNGVNGIVAVNGAHFALTTVNVHQNAVFGISIQTGSSAVLTDVTSSQNGLHGLDVQTGSAATVMGTLTVNANRVFGINVNGSAFTLSEATVTASGNALGIQIANTAESVLTLLGVLRAGLIAMPLPLTLISKGFSSSSMLASFTTALRLPALRAKCRHAGTAATAKMANNNSCVCQDGLITNDSNPTSRAASPSQNRKMPGASSSSAIRMKPKISQFQVPNVENISAMTRTSHQTV
jgi:hypothetical protein